ncbi:MAG: hypothetical protein IJ326_12560 [Lachnospiraceae bacterium]|nr:hypothetical protein [Lachnospiraceae bacterium]
MRKVQKQEILELVKTLHEAHTEVKGNVEKRQNHIAQSILADCQECAISIGNAIEAFEGEGFITISYLEEYCQVVFQTHESLNDTNVNENRIYKNLEKQLLKVENSIKNDITLRKEIAFFPYKASMWDSLESIYLAAKEDPNVDAYCVPIPYYDLKPDRSFGQMHYEGLEYPKNIEVIDWQTYKFEERKPDVIYIHNPYDDWNTVTSVHPRFYSRNLKAATEELVYVPYFVLQEIEPTDQTAIDGMKHFCFLPGVANADKVIVQSEKMKQIYVNEYYKAAKVHGLGGGHLDKQALNQKFLGLGSPKFDKVKNTRKEDLEIPAEWLEIIEKPDGSWKKIIFYNTSIAALLEHNEKMLEKMKWVFNIFKENKDEVALLWRPHPLIKSTVSAMRPWLWAEYDKLVQQYVAEGWGIYDDSADMDRAVVLSDAYYGDHSSVVQVYQQTGKPVMVQNLGKCEEDISQECKVELEDAVVIEDKIWFCTSNFKCLGSINLETKKKEYFDVPSEGLYSTGRAFGSMQLVGRKIFLIPFREKAIMEFDIDTRQFYQIEIDKSIVGNEKILFLGTKLYKDYLFIMGVNVPAIIRLNTVTREIVYITDWKNKVQGLIFEHQDAYFRKQNILYEDKLYVPFCNANAILEVDCASLNTIVHKLGDEKQGYSGICREKNHVWLSPRKQGEIVKWNIKNGQIEKTYIAHRANIRNKLSYIGIICVGDEKMLLPISGREKDVYIAKNIRELEGEYSFVQENGNDIIVYEKRKGILTLFNTHFNTKDMVEIEIDKNVIDIERIVQEKNNFLLEMGGLGVRELIGIVN